MSIKELVAGWMEKIKEGPQERKGQGQGQGQAPRGNPLGKAEYKRLEALKNSLAQSSLMRLSEFEILQLMDGLRDYLSLAERPELRQLPVMCGRWKQGAMPPPAAYFTAKHLAIFGPWIEEIYRHGLKAGPSKSLRTVAM